MNFGCFFNVRVFISENTQAFKDKLIRKRKRLHKPQNVLEYLYTS